MMNTPGGDSGKKPPEKKVEGIHHQHILTNQTIIGHPQRFGLLPHQSLHHIAKPLVSRPIAPAPGLPINVSTAKLLATPTQHTIVPKAALEGLNLVAGNPGTQTMAVNLSTQTMASNQAANQALHITMSQQSIQSLTMPTGGLGQAGTLIHGQHLAQDKDKSRIAVMPAAAMSELEKARSTLPMASLIRGGIPQVGLQQPTQVNLTLTPNPVVSQGQLTQTQTPIIHALPPAHIPRGAAAASALSAPKIGTVANPIIRPTTSHIQPPLLPTLSGNLHRAPIRPGTPTAQVNTVAGPSQHQTEVQSHISGYSRASAHIMTSLAGPSAVQISGLQGRPVLSQIQAGKLAAQPQPVVQAYNPQVPKQGVMTQSQMLATGTSGATIVSVSTPKLAGQSIALSIPQQAGMPRTPKIITTQVGGHTQLQPGQTTLSLSQGIPRGQKVPGAVVVNTAPKQGVTGINLSQAIHRPQKVMMGIPGPTPVTIATVPRPNMHGNPGTHSMNATTMVTTAAMATVPLMKVSTGRMGPGHIAAPQDHHNVRAQVANTQAGAHVQAGLYNLGAARPPLSQPVHTVASTTAGVTQVAAPGQDRTVRPGFPSQIPFSIQDYSGAISATNIFPYNLVYHQTAAFTSANTIRPNIVTGQPANLAATLATPPVAASASTATGIPAGVRINPPVMVNMDQSRSISMAPQYAAAKPAEGPLVTTVTTPVMPGAATCHPVVVTTSQSHGAMPANQQQVSGTQPPNASPRPSILRKRPHEPGVMIVKKNLLSSVNAVDIGTDHTMSAISPKPLLVDPSRENSQSSTDTASSTESTPQSEIKVKNEPLDPDNDNSSSLFSLNNNTVEASPRKKPRKQQLDANHEMRDDLRDDLRGVDLPDELDELGDELRDDLQEGNSSDEELDKLAKEDIKQELEWLEEERRQGEKKPGIPDELEELVDEEGVRWTRDKHRPPVNLLNHYACNWKARNNHFTRYTEVKAKDERRPTVNELANQKGIHQKASGWKLYHLAAQLEELMDLERDVFGSMSLVQECIAPKHIAKNPTMEDDISMVHELTQGNIQRCQLVMDQLEEARVSMVKVLDHKKRISEIINKHHSKRPVKKKERT